MTEIHPAPARRGRPPSRRPPRTRRTPMRVRKRNGDTEPVDVNKIVRAVERWADDLADVDPLRVATRTISGLYDGATTAELDRLSIQTAAEMIGEEPEYSRLAARLLAGYIDKEVRGQGIASFSQSIAARPRRGADRRRHAPSSSRPTPASSTTPIDPDDDRRFEYFGLRTVYDRYLLRHPTTRLVRRDPAVLAAARRLRPVAGRRPRRSSFYRLMSSLAYLPSSPTLFNSGTRHTQMSSCYLVDSPRDELDSIYDRYAQVAQLSKFAGGIGISFSRVRSRGALIRGTNGQSNGIVPWLRTLDSLGGRGQPGRPAQGRGLRLPRAVAPRRRGVPRAARQHRRGRPAHPQPQPRQLDPRRVHAPGRGRRAVVADRPRRGARAARPVGRASSTRRTARPRPQGRVVRQVRARELYGQMMRTLAQTGNGWMTFKDAANRHLQPDRASRATSCTCPTCAPRSSRCPATPRPPCATSARSTSPQHLARRRHRLGEAARHGAHRGDRSSTGSSTSTTTRAAQAAASNPRWRPVGLGRDGPAGRVLRAAAAVRLRRRRASCPPGSPRRST